MVARFTFCRVFNARFKSGSRHGEGFVNKHVAGASMQQQTVGYDGMRIRRVHTSIRPQKNKVLNDASSTIEGTLETERIHPNTSRDRSNAYKGPEQHA